MVSGEVAESLCFVALDTTHSSVLDWRIPGTAEPGGGLPSMGSHRVGHD